MKIKLAILEKDIGYLSRIVAAFSAKYTDKLEIYSFTEYDVAISALTANKIDVFIASDAFDIDINEIPGRCGFAYFVDGLGVDTIKGQTAVCKFQKADLIYKQILSLYSENASNISGLKLGESACRVVGFASPCGGVGCSTMAAAYAVACAGRGQRVLYLNLETYGASDIFFEAEGQFDMSDIIYALKSKKTNIGLKIESCVKQDASGVYFFSQPKLVLDIMEMGTEEILQLISELEMSGNYSCIVIDMDFSLEKPYLEIYKQMNSIVIVSEGTVVSNTKVFRAYQALATIEQGTDISLINRISVIYNKFSNKSGSLLENTEFKNLSGAPRYEHANEKQIVMQLSTMNLFEKIL